MMCSWCLDGVPHIGSVDGEITWPIVAMFQNNISLGNDYNYKFVSLFKIAVLRTRYIVLQHCIAHFFLPFINVKVTLDGNKTIVKITSLFKGLSEMK